MRITRLRTEVVHLPFSPVIGEGSAHELRSADCVLVFLESDQGLVGEGLVFSLNARRLSAMRELACSFEHLYRERLQLNGDGHAVVPDRPGWGFSFDPAAIKRYRAR